MPKSIKLLIALAKTEIDAGRTAKAEWLLQEVLERALALTEAGSDEEHSSRIGPSTLAGDLKGLYGLGGISKHRENSIQKKKRY